ncbi:hypothetical protein CAPTEDRAFT_190292 [Capitella teleta]|uniref:Uncharacterized protein n=1 Tax=Capitella teleta TaxID=283909 RepID=R7V4F3_CAPTE|nr:hypothetical protein CAPTEDRAFT_190292 [Capitella teleta]|eukprot:ELU13708.1 hypothetical protein CAPTEDRAFT_190292 [Capitella teleta]
MESKKCPLIFLPVVYAVILICLLWAGLRLASGVDNPLGRKVLPVVLCVWVFLLFVMILSITFYAWLSDNTMADSAMNIEQATQKKTKNGKPNMKMTDMVFMISELNKLNKQIKGIKAALPVKQSEDTSTSYATSDSETSTSEWTTSATSTDWTTDDEEEVSSTDDTSRISSGSRVSDHIDSEDDVKPKKAKRSPRFANPVETTLQQ